MQYIIQQGLKKIVLPCGLAIKRKSVIVNKKKEN